jgi:trk system potassium uptake protein TrkH
MTVFAALRKRQEVEMFRRSVRVVIVGRAITVILLFVFVLFAATLALSITEGPHFARRPDSRRLLPRLASRDAEARMTRGQAKKMQNPNPENANSPAEATEKFEMSDIMFEAASALGTVGLTTGKTAFLTTVGKLIIIIVMLIGRLGPLTLLAALTFNIKPVRYNYPVEAVIVG